MLKFIKVLLAAGYTQSAHDHSFFIRKVESDLVIILVYVDGLLITENSSNLIQEAKATSNQNFKMKDQGNLRYFLGIEILKSKDELLLNQRKYVLQLISEFGMSGAKAVTTPLEFNHKLTSLEYDQHADSFNDPELDDVKPYQRLNRKLLYLTITRPNICFSVQVLSTS